MKAMNKKEKIEIELKEHICKNCTGCLYESIYQCRHISVGLLFRYIQEKTMIEQFEEQNKQILEISQAWLANIANQIIQCSKEEREIWTEALRLSGKFFNKIESITGKKSEELDV
jgi:hypothetical protein